MTVEYALQHRKSCRSFLDQPADSKLLRSIIQQASRDPSHGNLQPWQLLAVQEAIGLVADFERAFRPCLGIALEPEKLGYGITPATSLLVKDSAELSETIKALREAFLLNELPKYCGFFSGMIENSGGRFLCGAEPTLADCCLAPALERYTLGYIDHVPKEALDAYPAMKLYLEAFKALPQVLAYEQSKS